MLLLTEKYRLPSARAGGISALPCRAAESGPHRLARREAGVVARAAGHEHDAPAAADGGLGVCQAAQLDARGGAGPVGAGLVVCRREWAFGRPGGGGKGEVVRRGQGRQEAAVRAPSLMGEAAQGASTLNAVPSRPAPTHRTACPPHAPAPHPTPCPTPPHPTPHPLTWSPEHDAAPHGLQQRLRLLMDLLLHVMVVAALGKGWGWVGMGWGGVGWV
jgi:hypothetical protein